jgi:DNA-binding MarR family transcriptional regulator
MAAAAPGNGERDDDGDIRWLTAEEKEAWTGLVSFMLLLPGRLESPLQHAAGLTLFEYLVLSQISEAPEHRLRMSELAYLASGSLSRLSNVVKRFEQRGWVARYPDPADGRYTIAELSEEGYGKVVEAAPVHLRAVRRYVLDQLNATDQRALARIAEKLRIRPEDVE